MMITIIRWTVLSFVGLLAVFAVVVAYDWFSRVHGERLEAKAWHAEFGDLASIGGRRMKLPADWWAKPIESDGTIIMRNVDRSLFADSGMAIIAHPNSGMSGSDGDILRYLRQFSHSDSTTQRSVMDLPTSGMTLHCSRELFATHQFEDFCYAANFPYELRCAGNVNGERECEAVLKTLN